MTAGVVVELAPEARSAGRARRIVEDAVRAAGLGGVLDEALLLVTELVTNAVVHAGTAVGLEVSVDVRGLRVEVSDRGPGRVAVQSSPESTREGGRGMFLLDALAQEWGTRYGQGGKAVWFLLSDQADERPVVPGALAGPSPAPAAGRRDLAFLLGMPSDLEARLGAEEVLQELLRRLVEGLELDSAWVLAAVTDDAPWTLAGEVAQEKASAPDPEAVRRGRVPAGDEAVMLRGSGHAAFGALVVRPAPVSHDDRALVRVVAERLAVVLRAEHTRAAQSRNRGSLTLLAEASELFAGTLDVQLAVALAAQLVVPRAATWSAVWTTYGNSPLLLAVTHADEDRTASIRHGLAGPAGDALATRLAGYSPDGRPVLLSVDELPAELGADASGGALVVPLVARRRLLGLLVLGHAVSDGHTGRPAEEVAMLLDLARLAALAVDNARLYEERSSVARALQDSLLPPELPVAPGLRFGARYTAAGDNEVGGDFYDVFATGPESWGIAIGDVCGKGPAAAAITGMARDVLRLLVQDGARPPQALQRLNSRLLELGDRGRFCTAVTGTVRRDGDGLVVAFSNGGHPSPVHLSADGTAQLVGTNGTLLGVLPDVDLVEDEVRLAPGDALVFYTDGVTERRNAHGMFGEYNLLGALRRAYGLPAAEVARLLEAEVHRFGAGSTTARDDLAVLVIEAVARPARAGSRPALDGVATA